MKHFKIVTSYEKYNFINAKKLAKIFANLIFGREEEDEEESYLKNDSQFLKQSIKSIQLCNEEIFEFLLNKWQITSVSLKISNKGKRLNINLT